MTKFVYSFGKNSTDGNAQMRDLLGGKGANLGQMDDAWMQGIDQMSWDFDELTPMW